MPIILAPFISADEMQEEQNAISWEDDFKSENCFDVSVCDFLDILASVKNGKQSVSKVGGCSRPVASNAGHFLQSEHCEGKRQHNCSRVQE